MQYKTPENRNVNWGIEVLRFSNRRINKAFYSVTCEILEKLGLTWFDLVDTD